MQRDIKQLESSCFDILVIGGGINGCGIARDASLRGIKTALVEKNDFASGASGKTTKLIHGGLRYLEQFNFKLVYEALRERAILLKTAADFVKPLEFMIPVYSRGARPSWEIRAGVFLYHLLAGRSNIAKHRALKAKETLLFEPCINSRDLRGSEIYYDAQVDDIGLCLANAVSADASGCCVANKVEIVEFIKEKNKIIGVEVWDKLADRKIFIRAKVIINATGAWSNILLKKDDPCAQAITRPSKGVHLIYHKLPQTRAVLSLEEKNGRVIFIIPWRGFSLIGTTDTDYDGSYDEVYAAREEVDYLLGEARKIFPEEDISIKGVIATFAGLRPLINPCVRHQKAFRCLTPNLSREHIIDESPSGLLSVVGGKYTTYRRLSEQVVDRAVLRLGGGNFKRPSTADCGPVSNFRQKEDFSFLEFVKYAVEEEMANSLSDLLFRRLGFKASYSSDFLEESARLMGDLLGWDDRSRESEINFCREEIRKNLYVGQLGKR